MTNYFLLTFDIDSEKILDIEKYGRDLDAANQAYAKRESEARDRHGVEVVLLGAESLDVIRRTHSNYFDAESSESTTQAFRRVLDSISA